MIIFYSSVLNNLKLQRNVLDDIKLRSYVGKGVELLQNVCNDAKRREKLPEWR